MAVFKLMTVTAEGALVSWVSTTRLATSFILVFYMSKIIEKGNIFLFRPKIEAKTPEDIERFYMVLKPDEDNYRVYIIGSQHLPEITEGQLPKRRVWALTRGYWPLLSSLQIKI
jgi:hypothetical protein